MNCNCNCTSSDNQFGYNAMLPSMEVQHDLPPASCGVSKLNPSSPGCHAICGQMIRADPGCKGLSLSYCDDQCGGTRDRPHGGGGGSRGGGIDPRDAFKQCVGAADHKAILCESHIMDCAAQHGCPQNSPCGNTLFQLVNHYCENPGGGNGGGGVKGGGGGVKGGGGGNGGGGGGVKGGGTTHSSQSFLDSTAGKVTMGVGGVILLVLIVLAVMVAMKKKGRR